MPPEPVLELQYAINERWSGEDVAGGPPPRPAQVTMAPPAPRPGAAVGGLPYPVPMAVCVPPGPDSGRLPLPSALRVHVPLALAARLAAEGRGLHAAIAHAADGSQTLSEHLLAAPYTLAGLVSDAQTRLGSAATQPASSDGGGSGRRDSGGTQAAGAPLPLPGAHAPPAERALEAALPGEALTELELELPLPLPPFPPLLAVAPPLLLVKLSSCRVPPAAPCSVGSSSSGGDGSGGGDASRCGGSATSPGNLASADEGNGMGADGRGAAGTPTLDDEELPALPVLLLPSAHACAEVQALLPAALRAAGGGGADGSVADLLGPSPPPAGVAGGGGGGAAAAALAGDAFHSSVAPVLFSLARALAGPGAAAIGTRSDGPAAAAPATAEYAAQVERLLVLLLRRGMAHTARALVGAAERAGVAFANRQLLFGGNEQLRTVEAAAGTTDVWSGSAYETPPAASPPVRPPPLRPPQPLPSLALSRLLGRHDSVSSASGGSSSSDNSSGVLRWGFHRTGASASGAPAPAPASRVGSSSAPAAAHGWAPNSPAAPLAQPRATAAGGAAVATEPRARAAAARPPAPAPVGPASPKGTWPDQRAAGGTGGNGAAREPPGRAQERPAPAIKQERGSVGGSGGGHGAPRRSDAIQGDVLEACLLGFPDPGVEAEFAAFKSQATRWAAVLMLAFEAAVVPLLLRTGVFRSPGGGAAPLPLRFAGVWAYAACALFPLLVPLLPVALSWAHARSPPLEWLAEAREPLVWRTQAAASALTVAVAAMPMHADGLQALLAALGTKPVAASTYSQVRGARLERQPARPGGVLGAATA
jgi:hypothetical protein